MEGDGNYPPSGRTPQSRMSDGWFHERWNGYGISLEKDAILEQETTAYQDLLVFKSKSFGNVLVLDGVIQCTERDEFTYQEMISHLPLNSHPNPKKVLVIGGGDGGVVREVLKYPSVDQVVLCEIDERVVEVCKQHLPSMASCLSDPRAVLHIGDGIKYLQQHKGEFDVIITDAPDPIGPAEGLYQKEYYENLKKSLKPNGIISCQGETLWFDLPLIKQMISYCRDVFPTVAYASGNTPTYPGGHMGFLLCSTNPSLDLKQPQSNFSSAQLDSMGLKYYSPEIHRAAFALPRHARKALSEVLDT
ncbi:spermidine synthase-like isoform X1 [Haliotis rubra]|uniref:spermidine synthase-like isoform X1 n=1 Tax=Haliotis rubra TaxID=36100 RepID=UPI001EE4FDBE|nr:spermidine synthase-like isoform X1 [Haliotis rubra]